MRVVDQLGDVDAEAVLDPLGQPAAVAFLSGVDVLEAEQAQLLAGMLDGEAGEQRDNFVASFVETSFVTLTAFVERKWGFSSINQAPRCEQPSVDEARISPMPSKHLA